MILDLLRHGDTGRRGQFDGRHDPPLLAGACSAWQHVPRAPWTRIISSPRQRALQTAQQVAGQARAIEINEDWAEWHFGDWEGRRREDIAIDAEGQRALAAFDRDPAANPPPGAEPWHALQSRVQRALRALATMDEQARVLVVSHAGPIRLALSLACGLPLPALWALRVDYGTGLQLRLGHDDNAGLWGELIEVRQA